MVSKEEYLNYMQGTPETSGYLTSPMFHEGFEDWNPDAWRNDLARGIVEETPLRGVNVMGGIGTETPAPGEYPYPDYDPARWGTEFGHEITHSSIPFQGWGDFSSQLKNPLDKERGQEEALNRLHDYMYGDYRSHDISGPGNYLQRNKYLSNDYLFGPHSASQQYWQMDFEPKAYDLIRNSKLKDWQKGVMSLGPTTSRGQVALGQRPDQVQAQGEAYMSPDRGNVQAPRMTSSQIRQEADRTGGTRHAGEMTQAAGRVRGPHGYQAGGSVNPFEETRQAARDWSPREQYISRSNQDRTQDASINRFIREGQGNQQRWEQGGGQGAYPVFNEPGTGANFPVSPGWLQASSGRDNSGVMLALANSPAINKTKNIYSRVDPFFPEVDVGDQQIGYDFNKNLWGGTLGFGGGYDTEDDAYNAYINWGTNW